MNKTNTGANTSTLQIVIDAILLMLAFGVALLLCRQDMNSERLWNQFILSCIFALIYILSNKEAYLYNVTLFYYLDRVHRKITKSFIIAMIATAAAMSLMEFEDSTRKFYLCFLIVSYIFCCLKMFLVKPILHIIQTKGTPRTAFVGRVGQFNKFRYFLEKTSIRINPIGYIATTAEEFEQGESGEYIGCLENLEALIREYNIDQLYIIQKNSEELPFTQRYVDLCIDMGVTVRLVVDFYKRRRANSYVSTVGTYPVITYHTISLNTYEQLLKRVIDIVGGLVGIILFMPIMCITAIAIKIDSPGPVLFKQTRVGQNGRHFKIYKFRSMYIDAEERKKELMMQNEIEGGVMFKMKDDPRVTKVGRIVRKLSIDELPQFFNVLSGTMSLVGTRPPTLDEVEKYKTSQWRRISIKPGITGLWQVSGRSNITSFDEIVELDVQYIDNWSIMLDFRIIIKTVLVLLKHSDAY